MSYETFLKKYRRKPLFTSESLTHISYNQDTITRILPHRFPLLFVDMLTGINITNKRIMGTRFMHETDPVFLGHFPQSPLYPGTFTLESIGQLGICLYHFILHNTHTIDANAQLIQVRASKIHGALFLGEIKPNDTITLLAEQYEDYGHTACIIGQALVNETIVCVSILEAILL